MYDLYIIQCFLCWIVYMKSAAPFHDHAYSSRRCRVHNRSVYPYRRINMRIYVIRTTLELLHIIMVSSSISLGWTSHDLSTTQTLIKVSLRILKHWTRSLEHAQTRLPRVVFRKTAAQSPPSMVQAQVPRTKTRRVTRATQQEGKTGAHYWPIGIEKERE
jgi:hypothetical protein